MTEENQKKLYEHFVRVGNQKNIDMMLKAYPHFKEEKKKLKSKGKK